MSLSPQDQWPDTAGALLAGGRSVRKGQDKALLELAGFPATAPPSLRTTLAADVTGDRKRESFLWGTLLEQDDRLAFLPSGRQGSGQNRSLLRASALLAVAAGCEFIPSGTEVSVLLIRLCQPVQ